MNQRNSENDMEQDRWFEALEWHATLSEGNEVVLTLETLRAWQQWILVADNRRVFDHVSRLISDCRGLSRVPLRPDKATANDGYDGTIPVTEWRTAQKRKKGNKRNSSARWAWRTLYKTSLLAATALLAAVLLVRPSWLGGIVGIHSPLTYRTPVGTLEKVILRDGSTITLGGGTRLSVHYTAHRRSIQLFHGEAWFKDKDFKHWPFVVTAGDGTITALGTAFVVNRDVDRVVVMVTSGIVEVHAAAHVANPQPIGLTRVPKPVLQSIRLHPNQEIIYSDDGTVGRVLQTSLNDATGWTRGHLVFDDVPLRYVIDNVDRYWSRRILVSPRAGELHFSGLIYENQIKGWLDGLRRIFPLAVSVHASHICVHLRRPASPPGQSACIHSGS